MIQVQYLYYQPKHVFTPEPGSLQRAEFQPPGGEGGGQPSLICITQEKQKQQQKEGEKKKNPAC